VYGTAQTSGSPVDVVVLAASAGGVQALQVVLSGLPAALPAAVLVVQHRVALSHDPLLALLARRSALPVLAAADGELLQRGQVVLCPADRQLLVTPDRRVRLTDTSTGDTAARCVADRLITSAAAAYGRATLAVVLTGRLSDGALGVRAVKGAGGRVVAQDPADAVAPGMPQAALATGCVDLLLPLHVVGSAITALAMAPGAAALFSSPLPHWARPLPPDAAA
jgi:two-component system, chemotaxis family, protein-glutamate methylesterase/glutaminase